MLKTLACPSYVQTQHQTDQGVIDAVMVPYDQFHTFMTDTHKNNMKILEVNMILSDLVQMDSNEKLRKIITRSKKYLADK